MNDQSQMNVLFISADQMRADSIGCYGNQHVRTPNIDRIVERGVRFSNAICQNPTCTPSRVSVMTGLYPRTHGVLSNGISMPNNLPTLPGVLAQSGYRTSICGKAHFRPHEKSMTDRSMCLEYSGVGPYYGFEEFHLNDDVKRGEYWEYIAMHHPEHLAAAMDLDETGTSRTAALKYWKNPIPAELHQTSWIADRAIEYIEHDHDEPFFLWCSFVDPHHPYNAPEPYHSMYDPDEIPLPRMDEESINHFPPFYDMNRSSRTDWSERTWKELIASYYAMITLIDDNIGRLIKALERTGQDKNTLIVFFADHGELLGDRGMLVKGAYHIDSLINVPLVIYDPRVNTKQHVHKSVCAAH
jgi:arylsulfatase